MASETPWVVTACPQAWDGFQTCSPNWLILVALKSSGTTKLWKSPALNKNRCQVVPELLSFVWTFPLKSPFPPCVWGNLSHHRRCRPVGTDGGEWKWWPDIISGCVSSLRSRWAGARHGCRPAPNLFSLQGPQPNQFPEILLLPLSATGRINLLLTFQNNEPDNPHSGSFCHRFLPSLGAGEGERFQSRVRVGAKFLLVTKEGSEVF